MQSSSELDVFLNSRLQLTSIALISGNGEHTDDNCVSQRTKTLTMIAPASGAAVFYAANLEATLWNLCFCGLCLIVPHYLLEKHGAASAQHPIADQTLFEVLTDGTVRSESSPSSTRQRMKLQQTSIQQRRNAVTHKHMFSRLQRFQYQFGSSVCFLQERVALCLVERK